MPEWLQDSFNGEVQLSPATIATRLLIALGLGCLIAGIYRLTRLRTTNQPAMLATMVMLTVLIAMVTLIIGDNIARAFSLVGALAIVRFRTVVEDTRDTAFVIFAVTVGMALGGGSLAVPLIGIPIVAAAAFLFRPRGGSPTVPAGAYSLTVRVGPAYLAESHLAPALTAHTASARLTGIVTARQGAAFDKMYVVSPRPGTDPAALLAVLNQLEGVQSVALQET